MPRAFSSGALSIWSYAVNVAPPVSAKTFVIAAVNDVLPWSTWPIVPMLQCGFVRANFSFAIDVALSRVHCCRASRWPGRHGRSTCPAFVPGSAEPSGGYALAWGSPCTSCLSRPAQDGAGEGNRTPVISLEGCCSTIELHPPAPDLDRVVGEVGLEPTKA